MSAGPIDSDQIAQVAELYKRVFATPPWNEAYLCTNPECCCNYGTDQVDEKLTCQKCGAPLQEYYNLEELTAEIRDISARTGFRIATLLNEDNSTDGFWYGWEGKLAEINEQKLSLPSKELTRLLQNLEVDPQRIWFYLAEFGMEPTLRGQGLGKELFTYGLSQTRDQDIIARTTPSSPAYFINRQNDFRTVWKYADGTGRVIMARSPKIKSI